MPCSQDDCQEAPLWRPVLEMRSRRGEAPTKVSLDQLGYCESHKKSSGLATFLSDEGFTKITKFLREAGRDSPDRSLTTLGWSSLSSTEAALLETDQHHTMSPEESLAF
jgi:hypothetical protein